MALVARRCEHTSPAAKSQPDAATLRERRKRGSSLLRFKRRDEDHASLPPWIAGSVTGNHASWAQQTLVAAEHWLACAGCGEQRTPLSKVSLKQRPEGVRCSGRRPRSTVRVAESLRILWFDEWFRCSQCNWRQDQW